MPNTAASFVRSNGHRKRNEGQTPVYCDITHYAATVQGWPYYPHPETKAAHWQDASVMGVIAPRLERLGYGGQIDLSFPDGSLFIDTLTR